jgi:thioredoxin reductase (NADPH)
MGCGVNENFAVIIIGAGPAGLAAAIAAAQAGLTYCVLDKGGIVNSLQHFPTGMTFFSTPELLEIGGVPFTSASMRPTRAEGLEYYRRVADHFTLNLRLYEEVAEIRNRPTGFEVTTRKQTYGCSNIILALGFFENPNMLSITGEDLPKVSHYYNEPYSFFRQHVAVIGGRNSAAIAALELYRHGAHVTMIHRRDQFDSGIKYWILPDLMNRVNEGSITAYFNSSVTEIRRDEIVVCRSGQTDLVLQNDFVFALTGYHPDTRLLQMCCVAIDPQLHAPIIDEVTFMTNVPGVYVAGSIVAGNNNNKIFIENGRHHGAPIIESILARR